MAAHPYQPADIERGHKPPDETPSYWRRLKKILVPVGVVGVLLAKFKGLLIPVLKFFPLILKTGGDDVPQYLALCDGLGWWFALGFVL